MDEADRSDRVLYELLDDTVFAGLDRRQLLGATRELEEPACRVGVGRIHVGFQSRAALADLQSLYRLLAAETGLDVHVSVVDEWLDDSLPGSTVRVEPTPEIGQFRVVAFDAGPGPTQQCRSSPNNAETPTRASGPTNRLWSSRSSTRSMPAIRASRPIRGRRRVNTTGGRTNRDAEQRGPST